MYKRKTFSDRLKGLRTAKKMTLVDLAKDLGISSVSLGYYEREERVPDIEVLERLCGYFNVTSDYLLGRAECPTPEIEAINKVTGLSEKALRELNRYNGRKNIDKTIEVINFIIEHDTPVPKPQEPSYQIDYDRTAQDRSDGIQKTLGRYSSDEELYKQELKIWEEQRIPLLEFITNYISLKIIDDKVYISESGRLTTSSPHDKAFKTENIADSIIKDEVLARDLYETWQKNKILDQLHKLKDEYNKSKEEE